MSGTPASSTPDARSDAMPVASPRPGAGTPSDYRFPHFATRILANGLRLIVANVPAYPVVTTLAVIEAGATRDPRDYEGLAQLTTRALAEGTRDMNALELTSRGFATTIVDHRRQTRRSVESRDPLALLRELAEPYRPASAAALASLRLPAALRS